MSYKFREVIPNMSDTIKYVLDEDKMPKNWYNIAADLPEPLAPVMHPGTGQPIGPEDLAPLFPMALIISNYLFIIFYSQIIFISFTTH